MRSFVTSIFLYACESWTLTSEPQSKVQAMEIRCYRKTLLMTYKDRVTKQEVCVKIQRAIGPHEDLTIKMRLKLEWNGHVSRSSGLARTILQSTVKVERRQGRQKKKVGRRQGRQKKKVGRRQGGQRKRWEDNIGEWAGLEFGRSQRAVENRGEWRKLIAKSSVVPHRLLRLRDS